MPTATIAAVPSPDHIAYVKPIGISFTVCARAMKELAYAARHPIDGQSRVNPLVTLSRLVPRTSNAIATTKNRYGMVTPFVYECTCTSVHQTECRDRAGHLPRARHPPPQPLRREKYHGETREIPR